MSLLIVGLAVAGITLLLIMLHHRLSKQSKLFEKLGVGGPTPHLIWGNFPEAFSGNLFRHLQRWTAEFGKNYGIFQGRMPVLVTSDPAVINDVFLKKFNFFHSRYLHPLTPDPDHSKNVNMFLARGLRWKRLRTISNPTFAVNNLKQLIPLLADSMTTLVDNLTVKANEGGAFNIYPLFKYLTGDVIARTALGQKDSLQDDRNEYTRFFNENLGTLITGRTMPVAFASRMFPELDPIWRIVQIIRDRNRTKITSLHQMIGKLRKEIEKRRLSNVRFFALDDNAHSTFQDHSDGVKDFIQLFVEAETQESIASLGNEGDGALNLQQLKISKKLTIDEIVQQCFFFLLAGFDTTANSLAYISYLLATNPSAQEKLIKEIDDFCPDTADITYEVLQQMPYLNQVTKEGLRMFPLASFVQSRTAVADCEVGDGIKVPKGLAVMIDVWSIHYDKNIWGPDADCFRPERFDETDDSNTRPLLSYIPFGVGPRMCIGMRFAILEEKMALVRILQQFRFIATENTKLNILLRDPGTVSPEELILRLESRR